MTDVVRGPATRAAATRLKVVQSAVAGLTGLEIDLEGSAIWFGRVEGNDVVIADPSISRHHAWLDSPAPGRWVLHDNQSSNGVMVGGQRVAEVELLSGQQFTLGATTFELVVDSLAPAAPAGDGLDRTVLVSGLGELAAQFERPVPLEELGERVVTAANRPFLMSDATSMWLVESGRVEIFTVGIQQGEPTGARSHFLTVEPGSAFFGLDSDTLGFDSGFLAVGRAGSELRRLDVERLQLYAPVPIHRGRLALMIATWVRALSRRLIADLPKVPDPKQMLRPGEEAELPKDTITSSGQEVVWLELPAAHLLFDGMASLSYESEGVLFPLAPGSWIELLACDEPVKLVPRKTEEVIDDPRLWAGLDVFHRVLMECELLNKRLAIVDEFNRLQRKAERAEEAREEGIGAIEAVLGGTRMWQRPSFSGADIGPVFRACSLIAETQNIEVRRPTGELDELSFEETVLAIATASRFRVRKVALVDDWWNHEHGPLLAQREAGETPVALLQTAPGAYDCVDPVSGERKKLDERVAATLIPFAYNFYRRFSDGALRAIDLVRFGSFGLKREFREVAMMAIAVGMLSTATPKITGLVFDGAIPQAERPLLFELCLGVFIVALATSAFKITQSIAMMRVQSKMDYSVQAAVWDRLLDLPTTFFREYSSGDLSDRAAAVDKIRAIVAGTGVAAILGSFSSLFNAVQMCLFNASLAAVAILLTVLYVSMTAGCNYLKLRLQRREMHRRGKITGLVLQLLTGVAKLRVSGTEDHAFRVWATEFAGMRDTAFKVGRISNFMPVLNGGFPVLASTAIFFTMAMLQQKALEEGTKFELSTGDFLAFNAAFGIFMGAMQALGDASVNLLRVLPIFERLKPILVEEPEVDGTKAAPAKLRGGIEISHVSFRYGEDSPWILQDMSLRIEPGEFVAFVGGSGSGKSTLMKVMLGFEKPEKGSVYYDGQDLSTLDVRLVRQQLGVVLQESRLLPADIYRNIVGSSSRTVADAWDAAAKSGLADDIKKMPMGMHTYVSEGGGGFSGGQKQRLMISRALVHQPKILYLDEATSALDNRTQAIVTESMGRLQATRVVIAHRLSTIANADKICYLEKGVIAEMGTYDELMAKNGLFAELARRQVA